MTLSLAMQEAEVVEDCSTQQGLTLAVHAVIVFKVGDDAIVDATKHEMARIGLAVDSLQISSIDDRGVGYIAALAAPHQAAVNHAAKIAQAVADQAAAQAQQESARNQAEYARQTAVARAQFQAVIDQAEQRAAQAGPLAAAQAMQDALVEQARVAQRNADLRQAQLIAEVIKPAEAEAEAVRTLAKAHADAVKLSAEAAAVQGRIALDQKVIEQLPDMLRADGRGPARRRPHRAGRRRGPLRRRRVAGGAGHGPARRGPWRPRRAAAVGHPGTGCQAPLGLRELTGGMVNREARRGADR
jgi:flotillin